MGCLINPSASCPWKSPRKADIPLSWRDTETILWSGVDHRIPKGPSTLKFWHICCLPAGLGREIWPQKWFISTHVTENILETLSGIYICLPFPASEAARDWANSTQNFHNPQYLINWWQFSDCSCNDDVSASWVMGIWPLSTHNLNSDHIGRFQGTLPHYTSSVSFSACSLCCPPQGFRK